MQGRHTVSDHDFPPLSFHTIGINLGQPLNAVERIDGRVYEGCLLGGRINVLPANLLAQLQTLLHPHNMTDALAQFLLPEKRNILLRK
ncbi:MAG: hypothetical protein PUP91_11995 [Rhizonema sp. PD37]|nr:hypothetical protein [Rhizonema sp. PD37]